MQTFSTERMASLMGVAQPRETSLSPGPWVPPHDMILRKTLQGWARAHPEEPPAILIKKLSFGSPFWTLCPRAPDSRDPGDPVSGLTSWEGLSGHNGFWVFESQGF